MSEYVKPNEKTVLLEPDQVVCHTDDKLRLLVIVYSSPVHYERRRVIRKTWGKEFSTYPGVKLVFLLGQSTKNLENDIGNLIFRKVFVLHSKLSVQKSSFGVQKSCLKKKFLNIFPKN